MIIPQQPHVSILQRASSAQPYHSEAPRSVGVRRLPLDLRFDA